jgi:hypothetical protein
MTEKADRKELERRLAQLHRLSREALDLLTHQRLAELARDIEEQLFRHEITHAEAILARLSLLARDCPFRPPTSGARAAGPETGNRLFVPGSAWRMSNVLGRRQRGLLIRPAQRESSGARHLHPSKLILSAASHDLPSFSQTTGDRNGCRMADQLSVSCDCRFSV